MISRNVPLLFVVLAMALLLGACGTGQKMATVSPRTASPSPSSHPSTAPTTAPIASAPAAMGADPYANLARQLHARGVGIWFEADMVARWLQGPAAFNAGLDRLATLSTVPGVVGFKVADELGYQDGLTTPDEAEHFLRDVRTGLRQRAPHAQVLIDVVVPDLGCLAWTSQGSSSCARDAVASAPAASADAVGRYLNAGLVDRVDVSTSLLDEWTYQKWGLTVTAAQRLAWDHIRDLGWGRHVTLQARKALAAAGGYQGSRQDADVDLHTYVDAPAARGAVASDIWTWRQQYDGQLVGLLGTDLAPNPLWQALVAAHSAHRQLFTHMTPSLLPHDRSQREREYALVAQVFSAVFVAAGIG